MRVRATGASAPGSVATSTASVPPTVRSTSAPRLREPEVGDAHTIVVADQHVGGLDVPVHEPDRVRRHDAAPRLNQEPQRFGRSLGRPGRVIGRPLPERYALDELHRHEDVAVVLAHLVDRDCVGVAQLREHLGLAPHSLGGNLGVVGVEPPQYLDRDLSLELRVASGVDRPHAARAELAHDLKAPDRRALGRGAEQPRRDLAPHLLRLDADQLGRARPQQLVRRTHAPPV